MYFQNKLQYDT